MKDKIEFIAFDADDTLWENELHCQEFERKFCHLLACHVPASTVSRELLGTEMKNLRLYGYGLIGNSIKSDILPVLELGGYAVHIPHHVTWAYEQYEGEIKHPRYLSLNTIGEVPGYL